MLVFFLTNWKGSSIKDTDCDFSGLFAATCKYECEQTGGCTAKYSGPPRSGNTIVRVPFCSFNKLFNHTQVTPKSQSLPA